MCLGAIYPALAIGAAADGAPGRRALRNHRTPPQPTCLSSTPPPCKRALHEAPLRRKLSPFTIYPALAGGAAVLAGHIGPALRGLPLPGAIYPGLAGLGNGIGRSRAPPLRMVVVTVCRSTGRGRWMMPRRRAIRESPLRWNCFRLPLQDNNKVVRAADTTLIHYSFFSFH